MEKPPEFEPDNVYGITTGKFSHDQEGGLWHKTIEVKGDLCVNLDEHPSGHFTKIVWKKGVGLIEYAMGYGAARKVFASSAALRRSHRFATHDVFDPNLRRKYRAIHDAISYAKFRSRSHQAVICVYDAAGNVIETHEHKGDSKSGSGHADRHGFFSSQSFWKRGSLRSGSQKGLRRRSAFVSPPGTCSR